MPPYLASACLPYGGGRLRGISFHLRGPPDERPRGTSASFGKCCARGSPMRSSPAAEKAYATDQARAALRGFELELIVRENGRQTSPVSRLSGWPARAFAELEAVKRFVAQLAWGANE